MIAATSRIWGRQRPPSSEGSNAGDALQGAVNLVRVMALVRLAASSVQGDKPTTTPSIRLPVIEATATPRVWPGDSPPPRRELVFA